MKPVTVPTAIRGRTNCASRILTEPLTAEGAVSSHEGKLHFQSNRSERTPAEQSFP